MTDNVCYHCEDCTAQRCTMTAQQEPEYRITESELDEYEIRYPKVSPTEMYNKILSRPIQQTKDITPLIDRQSDAIDRLESDIAGLRDCIDRHDAAIRKEERERVLSKLKGTIEDKVFEKDETIFDWLYNEIESLRAGDE